MKSLFELVSCFAPSELSEESPNNAYRLREETQALPYAVEDERSPRGKTRGKLNRMNSGSTAQWKPSLGAISEDKNVFVVTAKREPTVEKLPGKTAPKVRVRYHENTDTDGYRRSPTPVVLPAFTPTAFFF